MTKFPSYQKSGDETVRTRKSPPILWPIFDLGRDDADPDVCISTAKRDIHILNLMLGLRTYMTPTT
jgi:hypothetical protein